MSDTLGRVSDWSDSLYNIYIEDGDGVRQVRDEIEACRAWFGPRTIAEDEGVEGVDVTTSFLCLRWGRDEPPLVYETWARGLGEELKWRYSSRQMAKEGHQRVVELLRSGVLLQEIQ